MLTCIYMQNLIKIYRVVQEVWAFSLTATPIVIIVQTQGSCKTHIVIIVQTQGSRKTPIVIKVQTQGSCKTHIVIIVQTQWS